MSHNVQKYGLITLKALAALAFLAAGIAKLAGAQMMVDTFDAIGVGQWFRYLTGLIELIGAIALFIPGIALFGAGLLAITMLGAITAHVLVLGPSALPAIILLIITTTIAYAHRRDLRG